MSNTELRPYNTEQHPHGTRRAWMYNTCLFFFEAFKGMIVGVMAGTDHSERLLRYRASGDSQDSFSVPPLSPSSPPRSSSHQPAQMSKQRKAGKGKGSGITPEFTVEQHGPAVTGGGEVTVHNSTAPLGPPSEEQPDSVAITRIIMVTTTVVQIENHRRRGKSPKVKVRTKANTETSTEEEVISPIPPSSDSD